MSIQSSDCQNRIVDSERYDTDNYWIDVITLNFSLKVTELRESSRDMNRKVRDEYSVVNGQGKPNRHMWGDLCFGVASLFRDAGIGFFY